MGTTDSVGKKNRFLVAPSDIAGLSALLAAVAVGIFDLRWAFVPLGIYLVVCGIAPFVPSVGFFLPVLSRGPRGKGQVALTFDDGPHPETTPGLLSLLSRHAIHATFFVPGKQAEAHPELVRQMVEAGHEIGNHTQGHDVRLMLRGKRRIRAEIEDCQRTLAQLGIRPLTFRPPVGVTNPRLRSVLTDLDLECVTFSCRARDRGNRRVDRIARRILRCAKDGGVILLHDCPSGAGTKEWLNQVESVILGLGQKDLKPVLLSALLGRPVMELRLKNAVPL